jgi:two-component system, response regulator PdtaR
MSEHDDATSARVLLLIEDEPLVRMFNADVLVEAGFRVIEASTVDEGTQLFHARPDIEAVVTDIQTPGQRDGLELAHLICHTRPQVGIVIVSGRVRPGTANLPGGVQFIAKPYKPSDLLLVLEEALRVAKSSGLEC